MSYNINKSNGSRLVAVEDGSINITACDLTLVGKNYAGYGEPIATNFIKLLENFANTKQPAKPLAGQIWYDSGSKKIKFFNGTEFKPVPSLQASRNYPTDQFKGDLHYNESEGKLYYYDGTGYVLIGPQLTGKAAINIVAPAIVEGTDFNENTRFYNILKNQLQDFYTETDVIDVAVVSRETFVPSSGDYSALFPVIKQGITLPNADSFGRSFSSETGLGFMLWGTAADSVRLDGRSSNEYVRYEAPIFSTQVQITNPNGINIAANQLRLFSNANGAQITTDQTRISFSASSGGQLYNIINIDAGDNLSLLPSRTPGDLVNIGSPSNPFNDLYVNRIFGSIEAVVDEALVAQTVTLNPTNNADAVHYILFTDSASGDEAVRTDSGLTYNPSTNIVSAASINASSTITAVTVTASSIGSNSITKSGTSGVGDIGSVSNTFGTVFAKSTSAQYADLAEKYLADAEYEPGTVLRLGGEKEVTICATYESEMIAGIISTNPAYTMNDALEGGTYIALKGRVPCKVKGPVKKGDVLVSSSTPGHAEVRKYGHRTNPLAVLGKALQDFDGETGIIEVMVY